MVIFSTITLWDMALVAASFILGGMVKGALGFGLPLTTMALLPFFVPIDAALAVNVVVLFLTNIAQFLQMGQMRDTARRFAPVLWGIVIGVPLGALMITSFSDSLLMLALGAVVVVFSILSLRAKSICICACARTRCRLGGGYSGRRGRGHDNCGRAAICNVSARPANRAARISVRAEPVFHSVRSADFGRVCAGGGFHARAPVLSAIALPAAIGRHVAGQPDGGLCADASLPGIGAGSAGMSGA
jgi:hypothetical protein